MNAAIEYNLTTIPHSEILLGDLLGNTHHRTNVQLVFNSTVIASVTPDDALLLPVERACGRESVCGGGGGGGGLKGFNEFNGDVLFFYWFSLKEDLGAPYGGL